MTLLLDESPNQVAERLTGRDYLSWSAMSTYQSCPLWWHFRYMLGLPEETVSASLVFGSAIHRAAEHHYRELLAGAVQRVGGVGSELPAREIVRAFLAISLSYQP